jgi:A nuclease family of the HNH/ENDO VII superfamily with conserved AHH
VEQPAVDRGPDGLQEVPHGLITLPDASQLPPWLTWLFRSSPAPSSPPRGTEPTTTKSDGNGASPATGAGAQPSTPPTPPVPTGDKEKKEPTDQNGFAKYDPNAQYQAGYVAGVAIGIVPFGALVANILIDKGILAQGTPEARQGLAQGQMVGGIIGILWGGKPNASTPVPAGAPVPATVGGAAAPPLVVVPSGVGVVVAAGGAVNVAAAEGEMAASLSTGGGDKHHIATDKNKVAGQKWTVKFQELFDRVGVSLQDPRNKVAVPGHKGPHPSEYHELVYKRLATSMEGLSGDAAKNAFLKELDILAQECATPGSYVNKLVTR